ncbi:MAG TPA: hypothetical protein VFE45_06595, partial [Coriobacteriia bacterium]|nr:hypothetical protein [Coriobacteriia bacterium]
MRRRLDLIGLRRLESGRYGFVVIEGELGKNGELSEAVAEQLEHYVRHIRDEAPEAYARCYEKTYAQKRRLGLIIGEGIPENVRCGAAVEVYRARIGTLHGLRFRASPRPQRVLAARRRLPCEEPRPEG